MSMWDNMSFGEKLLAIGAIGTGAYFAAPGVASMFAGSGAAGAGSVPIDLGASGIGAGATGGTSVGSGVTSALENFGGAGPGAVATGAPVDQAAINAGLNSVGAGAGAAGAGAAGAGAAGAGAAGAGNAINTLGISQATSPWLYSITTPATTATGLWGTGAGAGAAGQAGLIGLGGGLGYAAIRAADKGYGVPPPTVDTGPLSRLQGAQGVPYLTDRGTTKKASGGLLSANPNPPMSYNTTPTYNNPTSTPVPQPVMHFAGGGSSQSDIIAPTPATGAYDQLGAYLQAMQAAQSQQAGQQELQAQQDAQQRAAQQSLMPGPTIAAAGGGMMYGAGGGISSLGHYSDGGQMLKGPGDGMSDSIPATIAGKQPARLANDEFVVPADVVSHLGNGSSDAGAKKLYDMMDRVRRARTGTPKQAKAIHPDRYVPG